MIFYKDGSGWGSLRVWGPWKRATVNHVRAGIQGGRLLWMPGEGEGGREKTYW